MEHLDKKEKELLRILLTDKKALNNFLLESNNPRFLIYLNGKNDKKINIFSSGYIIQKGKSKYLFPAMYLQRISEILKKENPSKKIKEEYTKYILNALKDIIIGSMKENKKSDWIIAQRTIDIIKNLGMAYLDKDISGFIELYADNGTVIYALLDICELLIDTKNSKVEKFIIKIIKSISNDESIGGNHSYYLLVNFFTKKKNLNKLAEFCSSNFVVKIAKILSNAIGGSKNSITVQEKVDMHIQRDNSINIEIRGHSIKFNLPYVEFNDKQKKILSIIKRNLIKYKDIDKKKLIKQILYFYTYIWKDLTNINYTSLNDVPQNIVLREQESILIYVLKEILKIKLDKEGLDGFNALVNQIARKNKYFIFKRIILYCYGKNFEKTRNVIFELLNRYKGLLFSDYFEAEVYNIMKENALNFSEEETVEIETLIENGPYDEVDWLDDEYLKKYESTEYKRHWQQAQYSPLTSIEKFKAKYDDLRSQTKEKEFLNFRDSVAKPVVYNSIFTDEEVVSLIETNPLEYINEIEKVTVGSYDDAVFASINDEPSGAGIAKQLQRLSQKYPKNITMQINNFKNLHPFYIKHIFYGLRDTQDKYSIIWPYVLDFIEKYIAVFSGEDKEKTSVMAAFSDIIPNKPNDSFIDCVKASELLYEFIKQILKTYKFIPPIYRIINGKKIPTRYLEMSINTPMGRVLEKLLNLEMSAANIKNKEKIKKLCSLLLERRVAEAHVFFGLYFVSFRKIDKDWTEKKTNNILLLANASDTLKYWEMFFEGFIDSNIQYLDYYDWMHSHYKKAIEKYKQPRGIHFMNLLAQFFLADKDKLQKDSLLKYCYEQSAFKILSACVRHISFKLNKKKFSGHQPTKEEITEENKTNPKAAKLWEFLWKNIWQNKTDIKQDKDDVKELLTEMLDLIPALDKLDTDNYGKICKILDSTNFKVNDVSYIFSNLLYLVNKTTADKNSILYLGKIYKKIILTIDYFTISDSHKEIICVLKNYKSNAEILKICTDIKAIYLDKSWNRYIEWFA
jgi:hypothetical protein